MTTVYDIIKYYTVQDLKHVSSRKLQIAADFISVHRAMFTTKTTLKLNTKCAKHLKTSLKTLQNAFPEDWYTNLGDRTVTINVPRELLHDASNTII